MTTTEPASTGPDTTGEGAPATGETTPTPADMPPTTGQATGAESDADGSAGPGEGEETAPGTEGVGEKGGKVKALQAARAEARQAQAALTATRKSYAESLATGLHVPGDLWMDGATVDRVLDESGNVSPDLVKALQAEQLANRPGLRDARPRQTGAGGGTNNERWRGSSNIGSWSGAAKATKNQGYDSKL